jgi:hypothetical protein
MLASKSCLQLECHYTDKFGTIYVEKNYNSWFQVYMGFTTIMRLIDKKKHCEALRCLWFGGNLNIGINHICSFFLSCVVIPPWPALGIQNASGGCLFLLIKRVPSFG